MRRRNLQNILTKEILEDAYNQCGSMQQMVHKLGISIDSISKYMKLFNIKYATHYRGIYNCNHHFFSLNNEQSFYWAGFLAADGSLQARTHSKILKVCLAKKDLFHLQNIKRTLESNHLIKEYLVKSKLSDAINKCVEIQIVSKHIYQDLARFNIVPNKTHIYAMPKWLLKHPLIHHFMRGYFDGDGCVSFGKTSKNRTVKQINFNMLGTLKFIKQYQQLLIKNCQLNANKILPKGSIYSMSYNGNKVGKRIYNFLYQSATIYLDRKKRHFQEILVPKTPNGA